MVWFPGFQLIMKSTKIYPWRETLWNLEVDAVVNSTNEDMDIAHCNLGLLAATGHGLAEECATMITIQIINQEDHTHCRDQVRSKVPYCCRKCFESLAHCYHSCLELFVENRLQSIAIGCIYTEAKHYPWEPAALVAIRTIRQFLEKQKCKITSLVFCTKGPRNPLEASRLENRLSRSPKISTTHSDGMIEAQGLYAPVHQHFIVARMDMAVDCKPGGTYNEVVEVDVKVEELGKDNVHNNAFYTQETLHKSESHAMRDCSEAKFLRRAAFLKHNLWVTPYAPGDDFPGGEFPNQNLRVGEGLASWVQKNRSLEETDIVLLKKPISFSGQITHVPRLEDWPVMPVEWSGLDLCFSHMDSLTALLR
ncbi:hypothetical protein M8C21_005869 [Ambrosia artemisiifolia]|uniref:Amine oxidase n=1 Tax=Ambrosia artemisiifolia TaxID=4212 RepID=A0AAD5G3W8_AMBAR|nr:hypothetical protein M8C21_005869 [Ambrosia artemisiifolia]